MSSSGTLSPRQQEGSYFEQWALCISSRSPILTAPLRVAWKWQKLAPECKEVYFNVLTRFKQLAPLLLQTTIIFFFNLQTCRHEYRYIVTPLNVKNIKLLALLHCLLMLWTETLQQLKWKLLMHTVFVLIHHENKNTRRRWRQIVIVAVFPTCFRKKKWSFPCAKSNGEVRQQVQAESSPLELADSLCLAQGLCGSPKQHEGMTPAPQTELCSRHVIPGLDACMLTSQKQVTGKTLLVRQMSLFALPQQLIRMSSSQVTTMNAYPADQLENIGPQFAVFPLFVFTCVLLCFLASPPPSLPPERHGWENKPESAAIHSGCHRQSEESTGKNKTQTSPRSWFTTSHYLPWGGARYKTRDTQARQE